jgi:ABC-type multidrug transport system ATPase subunit
MLRIEGLAKSYGPPPRWLRGLVRTAVTEPVPALRHVDLQVARGEIVGLIGPNGAGKSTLVKIVAGLLDADAGTVEVEGCATVLERRRALGLVLADDRGLYWRLDGRRNLVFFAQLQGLDRAAAEERATATAAAVGLDIDLGSKRVFGYSSGMRARLNLARALLHEPPVLVLDEPTRSLDPVASDEVGRLLRAQADAGRAVLLSSHRLDEVTAWCDRVVALVDGSVRFDGTLAGLETGDGRHAGLLRLLTDPDTDPDGDPDAGPDGEPSDPDGDPPTGAANADHDPADPAAGPDDTRGAA